MKEHCVRSLAQPVCRLRRTGDVDIVQHDQLAVECVQYHVGNRTEFEDEASPCLARARIGFRERAHIDERGDKTCFQALVRDLRSLKSTSSALSAECSHRSERWFLLGTWPPPIFSGIFTLKALDFLVCMFEDLVEGVRNPRALHLGFRGVYNRIAVRIICTLLVDRHPKGR